jgi:hypothetical protein
LILLQPFCKSQDGERSSEADNVNPAIAHIQPVNDGQTKWRAALNDSSAHGRDMAIEAMRFDTGDGKAASKREHERRRPTSFRVGRSF